MIRVSGKKESARVRDSVEIGEIPKRLGVKKRGSEGERGGGRQKRDRWFEFEKRCGETELHRHCRRLLRWQWTSGAL